MIWKQTIRGLFFLALIIPSASYSFESELIEALDAREFAQAIAIADECNLEIDLEAVSEVAGKFASSDSTMARSFLQTGGGAQKIRFRSMTAVEQAAACGIARETARKHGLLID